jgi:hypothetical protein
MSAKFRILRLEQSIPFEDVVMSWAHKREGWVKTVIKAAGSAKLLAAQLLELLDALIPASQTHYWSSVDAFKVARSRVWSIATGATPDPLGRNLQPLLHDLESKAAPYPKAKGKGVKGLPYALDIGDEGLKVKDGESCVVLDMRMLWCKAAVVDVRPIPEGSDPLGAKVHYRIHYDGWTSKWDEWVDKESGRIAEEIPSSTMMCVPSPRRRPIATLPACGPHGYHHVTCRCLREPPPPIEPAPVVKKHGSGKRFAPKSNHAAWWVLRI